MDETNMYKTNQDEYTKLIVSGINMVEHGASRLFTVIAGVCFYRSSGINSKSEGTWFPALGINNIIEKPCHKLKHVQREYPPNNPTYLSLI
jgi:hypothetical protein